MPGATASASDPGPRRPVEIFIPLRSGPPAPGQIATLILPAHFSDLDEGTTDGVFAAPYAVVKATNDALRPRDEAEFTRYVLGHLPASIVSPTLILPPVLTTLLAIPLLGEVVHPAEHLEFAAAERQPVHRAQTGDHHALGEV